MISSLFLTLVTISKAEARHQPRVRNGHRLDIRSAPWMAYMTDFDGFPCSASVIGRRQLITAQHCTCTRPARSLYIITGKTFIDVKNEKQLYRNSTSLIRVVRKFEHPRYFIKTYVHNSCFTDGTPIFEDFTILYVDRDLRGRRTRPIELDFSPRFYVKNAIVMGYGLDENRKKGMLKYYVGDFTMRNYELGTMLCHTLWFQGRPGGGDSGGPIVKCSKEKCRLIGVVSGGSGREECFASTYQQREFLKRYSYLNGSGKNGSERELFTVMLCQLVSVMILRIL